MKQETWQPYVQQGLATACGVWLIAAPAVLGYATGPEGSPTAWAVNDRVVGPFIACLGIVAFNDATRAVRFWNIPLGLWMVLAAALWPYPPAGMINAVAVGLATAILPLPPRPCEARFGGGLGGSVPLRPLPSPRGPSRLAARPDGKRGGVTTSIDASGKSATQTQRADRLIISVSSPCLCA